MKISILKPVIPYIGLPIIGALLIILRFRQMDTIIMLWCVMLVTFGYIISVSDIKTKTIPNKLVLIMLAAWVVTMIPLTLLDTEIAYMLVIDSLIGFAVGGIIFLLAYIISRKGLGGGDVKFMAVAGLYLGFYGVIPAMLYGSILAAITGIVLLIIKKLGRKDKMPFAPFLYAGMVITMFVL